MDINSTQFDRLTNILHQRLGSQLDSFHLPPPSFTSMKGEILDFDDQAGTLSARYPILESQLNPFNVLQGGFLAAAVDNTFGPLSLLVAPPSVTRHMELTYSRPATLKLGYIVVNARLTTVNERQIELSAEILDPQGNRLARAQATHWIIQTDIDYS